MSREDVALERRLLPRRQLAAHLGVDRPRVRGGLRPPHGVLLEDVAQPQVHHQRVPRRHDRRVVRTHEAGQHAVVAGAARRLRVPAREAARPLGAVVERVVAVPAQLGLALALGVALRGAAPLRPQEHVAQPVERPPREQLVDRRRRGRARRRGRRRAEAARLEAESRHLGAQLAALAGASLVGAEVGVRLVRHVVEVEGAARRRRGRGRQWRGMHGGRRSRRRRSL